jgi:hypothetical protein
MDDNLQQEADHEGQPVKKKKQVLAAPIRHTATKVPVKARKDPEERRLVE